MWPDSRHAAGLLVLFLSLLPAASAASDVAAVQVRAAASGQGPEPADIVYPLAVLAAAGWDAGQVERAIREVEAIFGQCGVRVTAGSVHRLQAPEKFRELDAAMQPRMLAELPATRPLALLIDRTADRDVAFSYRLSAPTPSRGTAWVTRHSESRCLAPLLAHELGHVLLDTDRHSRDRDNLMFHTCAVSNVAGARPGTDLTEAQCERLRAR